jgi:DNA-directed RNA polymerase subunit G
MVGETVYAGSGIIENVRKQLIPKMYVATFVDKENNVIIEFDVHEDLVVYKPGQKVSVTISKSLPEYKEGEDYVVHATVAAIKKEENKFKYLLSAGGLLFVVTTENELQLTSTEKVYVKVSEKK